MGRQRPFGKRRKNGKGKKRVSRGILPEGTTGYTCTNQPLRAKKTKRKSVYTNQSK